jgi:hypothetical protein
MEHLAAAVGFKSGRREPLNQPPPLRLTASLLPSLSRAKYPRHSHFNADERTVPESVPKACLLHGTSRKARLDLRRASILGASHPLVRPFARRLQLSQRNNRLCLRWVRKAFLIVRAAYRVSKAADFLRLPRFRNRRNIIVEHHFPCRDCVQGGRRQWVAAVRYGARAKP